MTEVIPSNHVAVRLRKCVEERFGGLDFLRGVILGAAGEIERLENQAILIRASAESAASLLLDVQQDCLRLRAALERYGKHEDGCLAVYGADGDQCSCGFAEFCTMCKGRGADTSTSPLAPLLKAGATSCGCANPSMKCLTTDTGTVHACERCSAFWFTPYGESHG